MRISLKYQLFNTLLAIILLAMYMSFAYDLDRADFSKLISLVIGLFGVSYALYKRLQGRFWILAGIAILSRLIFLPTIPNLSQDFYRFLWDGRLLIQGINPYLTTVQTYMESGNFPVLQARELFAGMGALNASHFTNYPPINQLCFAIAGWLFPKSIIGGAVTLRVIIILADIGILYFGSKLLKAIKLPKHLIFLYVLNPFVIIELTGNLHFEGVMLFFLVWALYLLQKKQWLLPAILIGLSISVKLIPLLLLPMFLKYFRKKLEPEPELELERNLSTALEVTNNKRSHCQVERSPDLIEHSVFNDLRSIYFPKLIGFYTVIIATVLLTFAPFLSSEFISNFSATIGLWFQNFEFNASVYYIIRWIGFQVVGWNIIGTVGKVLPLLVIFVILILSAFRKNYTIQQLATGLLFAISAYFLLSTTVHPWYVATPLVLCVFTRYRFPVLWSLVVFLSYSAYGETFKENLWFVALEYIIVIGVAVWEIIQNTKDKVPNTKASANA